MPKGAQGQGRGHGEVQGQGQNQGQKIDILRIARNARISNNIFRFFFPSITDYPGQDLVSEQTWHTLAPGNHPGALINGFSIPWHTLGERGRFKDFTKVSINFKKPETGRFLVLNFNFFLF